MLDHSSRITALAITAALALGCAVTPDVADQPTGQKQEAMLIINPGPIFYVDPVTACSSTVADHTSGYPAQPGYRVQGTSDASKTCDYYVTEVTGVQWKDIKFAVAAQPELITDQTSCQNSFETYVTFGYRPAHWAMNGQGLYYPVPAAWEQISTKTINGVWLSNVVAGQPNCALNPFVYPYGAGDVAGGDGLVSYSPYTTIRVATKAVLYTYGVAARANMDTYVLPAP
jgi:hypothetical protein